MAFKGYSFRDSCLDGLQISKLIYSHTCPTDSISKVTKIVLHHTKNRQTLKSIYTLHVLENKWAKIGYHFVISKLGRIYQTRELFEMGAHAYGANEISLGVALIGNFDIESPTQLQLEVLIKLLKVLFGKFPTLKEIVPHNQVTYDYLLKKYDLPLSHVDFLELRDKDSFEIVKKNVLSLLKAVLFPELTTCPGLNFYPVVRKLKEEFSSE